MEVVVIKDIYLDYAATTPLTDSVKEYVISLLDNFYNPSSTYQAGQNARQIINDARQSVAKFINAKSEDIYFTSGGSASNTLAIRGYNCRNDCMIFYSPIAHKSILKCVDSYHNTRALKVDSYGFIDINDLEKAIDMCIGQPFVIIDYANSEIGTIQDVQSIINITHSYKGIVYLDCTGSISQIPIDVKSLNVDMIGFSGHKIGALKGCGVLYKKPNIELEPLVYGNQESGLVGGTENLLGIASLGKAVEEYDYAYVSQFKRDYVYDYIINNIPDSYLVGAPIDSGNRLPHNLFVCFKGVQGESLMLLLDVNGIKISTGSACNSGKQSQSSTLSAIGMNKDDINSCIRMTFSENTDITDLRYICVKLKKCVESLRRFN